MQKCTLSDSKNQVHHAAFSVWCFVYDIIWGSFIFIVRTVAQQDLLCADLEQALTIEHYFLKAHSYDALCCHDSTSQRMTSMTISSAPFPFEIEGFPCK